VTDSESSDMSLRDALAYGQQLLGNGELERAEDLYRQLFRAIPEHAEVTQMLGVVLLKVNRAEEASVLIEKSLQLNPAYLDAHINLGYAYLRLHFEDRAEEQFRSALRINASSTEALFGLGNLLGREQQYEEAERCYKKILEVNPEHRAANSNLALLLVKLKRNDDACVISKAWLDIDPDNESAKMLHASLSGENVPARASDDYVRNVFDNSAAVFDTHLEALDYRAPQLAERLVEEYYPSAASLSVLDAGCGTGLCGSFLKRVSGHLKGVDLSSKMIALAEKRDCYDSLEVVELTEYLSGDLSPFDLIVCVDTLCYIGPLDDVLQEISNVLKVGGHVLFTLEELADTSKNYSLHPGRRYSHNYDYAKRIIADCGLDICTMNREILRNEGKEPVHGLLVVAGH